MNSLISKKHLAVFALILTFVLLLVVLGGVFAVPVALAAYADITDCKNRCEDPSNGSKVCVKNFGNHRDESFFTCVNAKTTKPTPDVASPTTTTTDPGVVLLTGSSITDLQTEADKGFSEFVGLIYTYAVAVAALLAVLMIMAGGITYMTSEIIDKNRRGKK